ncbi:hypothetical protein HPB47_008462, partial [Ixodes persulcatus]
MMSLDQPGTRPGLTGTLRGRPFVSVFELKIQCSELLMRAASTTPLRLYGGEKTWSEARVHQNTMADEDVVITGFSAYFPQANHLAEFQKKLYDGVDMVTDDEARWPR